MIDFFFWGFAPIFTFPYYFPILTVRMASDRQQFLFSEDIFNFCQTTFSPFQVISYHYTSMLSHLLIFSHDASRFQVPSCALNTTVVPCNSLVRYLLIKHFVSSHKNPFPAPESITYLGYFSSLYNVKETTFVLLSPVFSEKENFAFFQKTLTQISDSLFSTEALENTKEE